MSDRMRESSATPQPAWAWGFARLGRGLIPAGVMIGTRRSIRSETS